VVKRPKLLQWLSEKRSGASKVEQLEKVRRQTDQLVKRQEAQKAAENPKPEEKKKAPSP
jgi:hypothetical protein